MKMGITKHLYLEGDETFEVMRSCDQRDENFTLTKSGGTCLFVEIMYRLKIT
jgi:hypothetical protein